MSIAIGQDHISQQWLNSSFFNFEAGATPLVTESKRSLLVSLSLGFVSLNK